MYVHSLTEKQDTNLVCRNLFMLLFWYRLPLSALRKPSTLYQRGGFIVS